MVRESFNYHWNMYQGVDSALAVLFGLGKPSEQAKEINLPYDAMIHEKRSEESKNKGQTGYYPGKRYTFAKTFIVPEEWKDKRVTFEFQSVYMNASVYINGEFAGNHPYGYNNFYISADDFLKYGTENDIKVVVNNTAEENSRWYSGTGILGGANLIVSDPVHIGLDSVKITTPQIEDELTVVQLDAQIENGGQQRRKAALQIRIKDTDDTCVGEEMIWVTTYGGSSQSIRSRITVSKPKLWSCETPNLYMCELILYDLESDAKEELDQEEVVFGIRSLTIDAVHGLRINGKETKLRGTCIHHDHGILGGISLQSAEDRKVRLIKAAGFNCIRMGHTPATKELLNACDKYGVLMMDELADMWDVAKNANDYAMFFPQWWEADVEAMVKKDRNHPSVILYSTGNELQEAGTSKGAEINRKIADKIRSLDDTRFITNAINPLLAGVSVMKEAAAQMHSENQQSQENPQTMEAGSNLLNMVLSSSGTSLEDMYCHPLMVNYLREFSESMDVVGFNYATSRDEVEARLHPHRMLLATETYPADVYRVWKSVKNHKNVMGEMTWTGYDYLGEAGIGIFYYDGNTSFSAPWPDSVAYTGDLDLTGNRRCISYYREAVYGLSDTPFIQVERMTKKGQPCNKSLWSFKDYLDSWTWPGYEGESCQVDVYSAADEVELFINGRSLGRKKTADATKHIASYEMAYEPGTLEAVAYVNGQEADRYILKTAEKAEQLLVQTDEDIIAPNEVAFVTIELGDKEKKINKFEQTMVKAEVTGAGLLAGFGSADPRTEYHYQDEIWPTYDGRLLLAVRAGESKGSIRIRLTAEGYQAQELEIEVKE